MSFLIRRGVLAALGRGNGKRFSTNLWIGNGTSQDIETGISGDTLTWPKARNKAYDNVLFNALRGATKYLVSNETDAEVTNIQTLTSFNSKGYSLGSDLLVNEDLTDYVGHTFLKAAKFADFIEYIGDGVAGRELPHELEIQAGLCFAKRLDTTFPWVCQHIATGGERYLTLNTDAAAVVSGNRWNSTDMTDEVVVLGSYAGTNGNGFPFIMYIFAHDPSPEGTIQCSEFDATGGNVFVDLGWDESIQYIMIKPYDSTGDWEHLDTTRGIGAELNPNLSNAETVTNRIIATPGGFTFVPNESTKYVYMAVRGE